MHDQSGSFIQRAFKFIRLGVGFCLVLFAIFLLRPDSEYIQQMQRLEYEGQSTEAKLIDKIEGRSSSATKLPPGVGGALGSAARGFAAGKRLSDSRIVEATARPVRIMAGCSIWNTSSRHPRVRR